RAARRDRGPLGALLEVLAEQVAVVEEDLEQLYDDQFIETCAPWVVPYIGDLVGWRALHGSAYAPGSAVGSARAEVANTIAYRRRKGTAAMLEQLARDVTGWNARAVEFFALLATTQYMNHLRPHNPFAPDLRRGNELDRLGTAFDPVPHTADVRRAASGRGRYNLPNVGIFLWRLDAYAVTDTPAVRVDDRRWRLSPLGNDVRLFNRPETEAEIAHLAEPANVPEPLTRRALAARLADALDPVYGPSGALALFVDGVLVNRADVRVCNLSDDGGGWAHAPPPDYYAVDPVLGRVALPATLAVPVSVSATWHRGFSADTGGGEYDRAATFASAPGAPLLRVPDDHPTLQAALNTLGGDGVVEITDNRRYAEAPQVAVAAHKRIELRAADGCRPTLALTGEMTVTGGARGEFALNGLLVAGERIRVPASAGNALALLRLSHLTLVPGWTLDGDGDPQSPAQPSLVVELGGVEVVAERVITGGVRVVAGGRARFAESIVDAVAKDGVAYAAPDGFSGGGELELDAVTVVGKVHAQVLRRVSNSILLAAPAPADSWTAPVLADRRQEGCVRFSWLPPGARVPRRFHCVTLPLAPRFTTLRYGLAAYGQLSATTPAAIRTGAEDEGEMGAFHPLYQPQRESNLRTRLDEYLRVGLEAGIFHAT
ncbi:MAG TPA: hypothetical protein VHG08_04620, partial [Longimicrobium sp.]|nr:hypothetical protein [Longimicrobium sp.]